ncbi:Conserved hypothetical protein [Clostridium neonatale]|uniref:DUF1189 family protein n=1 Tax=Clostridium neonatale TaxID=137838 RepID=UPI00291BAD01|nr:DUF1189 family protein [Clostridium neonatale]CAI3680584.1 Conserved hypothetical protein [Clostridium neonatale]
MKNKTNFLKKFITSIYDIDVFSKYIKEGVFRAIIYMILMTIIVSSIKSGIIVHSINKNISGIINSLENNNGIYIEDGELTLNCEPITLENNNILIYIDDNDTIEESWKLNGRIYTQDVSLLWLKNGIVFYDNSNVYKMNYKNFLGNENVNSEQLRNILNDIKIKLGIVVFKVTIWIEMCGMLVNSFIITMIASLIAIFMKMIIRYSALYSMVIYAAILPFIIKIILECFNYNVDLDSVFIIGTVTYIIFILRHIKAQILGRIS